MSDVPPVTIGSAISSPNQSDPAPDEEQKLVLDMFHRMPLAEQLKIIQTGLAPAPVCTTDPNQAVDQENREIKLAAVKALTWSFIFTAVFLVIVSIAIAMYGIFYYPHINTEKNTVVVSFIDSCNKWIDVLKIVFNVQRRGF